jgi:hypothetical protein
VSPVVSSLVDNSKVKLNLLLSPFILVQGNAVVTLFVTNQPNPHPSAMRYLRSEAATAVTAVMQLAIRTDP